jgi:hypothetical protein
MNMPIQFLTIPNLKTTLLEDINTIEKASDNFCIHWQAGDKNKAIEDSREASAKIQHLVNEIIQSRDSSKNRDLKKVLNTEIGEIVKKISTSEMYFFKGLKDGEGQFPSTIQNLEKLTLIDALNKIKHADVRGVKFDILNDIHILYIFSNGNQDIPNSICKFDVKEFCSACKMAIKFRLYMDSKVFLTRVESKEESRALPRFLTL